MNGEYIDSEELHISPFDHGFLYGLGFFETFRTYNGKVPFLKEHMARLKEALQKYRIEFPYTIEELQKVIVALNDANDEEDGYFRLNVSAGNHDIGLAPTSYNKPNVILFRKKLLVPERGTEKAAVLLVTKRNVPEDGVTRFKGHHYGNNVVARLELPNLAEQEGFFLTQDDFVAEGITSNIFWVKNDIIYTPAIDTGILPGITRAKVIMLAKNHNIEVVEGEFSLQLLLEADECFITTAIQELIPIKQFESQLYLGNKGPIYYQLHSAYANLVNGCEMA